MIEKENTSKEEYKKQQEERLKKFIVGSKDLSGNFITRIFSKGDEFVVYEIKTNELSDSIKVFIDTKIEEDKKPINNFSDVREKFIKLKGLLYKVVDDTSIKNRIAHILAHAIYGNPIDANKQFNDLIEEIEIEYKNQYKHRIRYLITTFVVLLVLIFISILIYYTKSFTSEFYIRYLIFISTAASIGGFISITRRIKKMIFEKDVSAKLYIFYAFERMMIAIVAGAVMFLAIKSNLMFGLVKNLNNPIFGYLIFAVAAGFSETLIPNLLIKLEKKEN